MEPAHLADSMVESIGVCTHWTYADTPYGKEFSKAKKLLKELGVRYIRDRFTMSNIEVFQEMGVKTTAIIMPDQMSEYLDLMRKHPDAVVAIEGPNETNIWPIKYKGAVGFPQATRLFQDDLYAIVKKDAILASIPVIATSTAYMGNNTPLAPLTSFDYAVIHSYPNGRSPSLLQPTLDNAQKILGINQQAKRIIATEAGYHTAYGMGPRESQGTTEMAKSKLILRLLAEYFKQGVVRTHIYEFICTHEHQNSSGKRSEAKYGLVNHYMVPTSSYVAMKNYIAILKEPDASYVPNALDMTIATSTDTVHHLLLHKSDGTYFLLLWNDVPVYHADLHDPMYGQDQWNPDVPVKVALPNTPVEEVQIYRPTRSEYPVESMYPQQELKLHVPDDMVIVSFKLPQTKTNRIAPPQSVTAQTTTTNVNLQWQKPANEPDLKGYFIYRLGQYLGFTQQTHWVDTVTLPGIGYTYSVQSVDMAGNVSARVQHMAMTQTNFPDIIITNVSWDPLHPKSGEKVTFKATIKNIGQYESPAMTHGVAFRIDQKMVCWSDTHKTPMSPGQSLEITPNSGPNGQTQWVAKPGKHTLTVFVDDQDRFREDSENNNQLDRIITTETGQPDLTITDIKLLPTQPRSGDTVGFAATITNIGTAPTPQINHGVAFHIDGKIKAWGISRKPLLPGQSVTIKADAGPNKQATWIYDGEAHTILAHVDDVNRIKESDENNNKQTINLQAAQ